MYFRVGGFSEENQENEANHSVQPSKLLERKISDFFFAFNTKSFILSHSVRIIENSISEIKINFKLKFQIIAI